MAAQICTCVGFDFVERAHQTNDGVRQVLPSLILSGNLKQFEKLRTYRPPTFGSVRGKSVNRDYVAIESALEWPTWTFGLQFARPEAGVTLAPNLKLMGAIERPPSIGP